MRQTFLLLDEGKFWEWFQKNSPHCGKGKTMKRICEAFPEAAIDAKQPYPPYGNQKYCNEAAIYMNLWKEEGRIITEKRGRVWCYIVRTDFNE